ncbi:MAG: TlpA family protein disulfide reductase [Candidatus Nanopelagicales bacterium]|nr:TlpA family protein disulfide reductase [Candidatus Nanopelagicales bacterium]
MKRLVLLLCFAVTVSACGNAGGASAIESESGFVGGDGSIIVVEPAQRAPAPDVRATTLDGDTFDLADHRGETVVINVWASWCAPCRAEAGELQEVWEEEQGNGVQFVGLNTRDSTVAAQGFVESMGLTFPSIFDPDGQVQLQFSDSLPPQAIPSTLVIDGNGRVAARILGKVSAATLRGVIDEVADRG